MSDFFSHLVDLVFARPLFDPGVGNGVMALSLLMQFLS